jgi:hypothetical protein
VTTLPPSLVRFQSDLEEAVGRERRRRPRRLALRIAVAAAAAAAVSLGVLSALPGSGPSIVQRAAAALRPSDGTILHVVLVGTTTGATGQTETVRLETWHSSSAPYDEREVLTRDGRTVESATLDGVAQLYDPSTNTIFVGPKATEAAPGKVGAPPAGDAEGDRYRAKILGLLDSGRIHEAGHVSAAGRDAIRLVSDDGSVSLLVDASTYEPIEWRVSQDGITAAAQFPVYERLAATGDNLTLVDLRSQHRGARIDESAADYGAAVHEVAGK